MLDLSNMYQEHTWNRKLLCKKELHHGQLRTFLNAPEHYLKENKHICIKGLPTDSTAVFQVDLDHQPYIIKRFNIKNNMHAIKRAVAPSKAMRLLNNAKRLEQNSINTISPIAMLEYRYGPFIRTSYVISHYIEGASVHHYMTSEPSEENRLHCARLCTELFQRIKEKGVEHRDLQWANLLFTGDDLVLIDIENVRWHNPNSTQFKKRFDAEINHFLALAQRDKNVHELFRMLLEK